MFLFIKITVPWIVLGQVVQRTACNDYFLEMCADQRQADVATGLEVHWTGPVPAN
jgi:hypothetical protein